MMAIKVLGSRVQKNRVKGSAPPPASVVLGKDLMFPHFNFEISKLDEARAHKSEVSLELDAV